MKKILLFLLVLTLIIIPASAGNYTMLNVWSVDGETISFNDVNSISFDAAEQNSAIAEITISGIQPATVDITLTQGNGAVHTGKIIYSKSGVLGTTGEFTLQLNNESKSWSGLDVTLEKIYITAYVRDQDLNQDGLMITDGWIGSTLGGYTNSVFSAIPDIGDFPITKVSISCADDKINAVIKYAEIADVKEEIKDEDFSILSWLGTLFSFVTSAGEIVFSLIYVFKLLFVDHLLSIIVLYESVCMAYAAHQSRDIISFLRKFVRYNRALVEALIGFISVIISIFHRIIDAIKPF